MLRVPLLVAALLAAVPVLAQSHPDPALLSDIQARSIGPAGMSGRVTALAVELDDPNVIYVGAATGGLWKSVDGGLRFRPIFDDQTSLSIGAIAIHPARPEVVWVGTGEGNPRNSVSVGRGVFRSLDGGRSWKHVGLPHTERIRRIRLHPTNPDVAYVAALGTSWGENEERGVFKTNDGGETWEKVLFVDTKTGCANLVMDPENPDKLFANMWEHRRWPWSFRSGGPGSGLHRTLDGGRTWTKLSHHDGLPKGDLGRIGLAIAPSDPDVVYALVEAKKSVLLRSDDGGFRFRTVNDDDSIAPRPFYYADIRVDPADPERVINMHTIVTVSEDGGKTFGTLIPYNEIHPDHHAMFLHPKDPNMIVEGNDGGIAISRDGGKSWRYARNLPLAQFYHIAVDLDVPYNVYGGLQDNGSWRGPSAVWENGGIRNYHWEEVCFGDGFNTLPDPGDSMQGYAMSQQGYLRRWNLRTGERKDIRPVGPEDTDLRFNWNAALAQDPFDAKTIYFGSQFVHKSTDRGDTWEIISPDLTSNYTGWQDQANSGGLTLDVTGAENFTTIIALAPSPLDKDVLWAGTDDGRVHITRDGGKTWRSVESRISGLPRHTWCPHIEVSRHAAGTAFAVFDDHRRANWKSYVYRTDDFGETWTNLAGDTGNGIDGYCLAVAQDPVNPDLLFVGTEFGLFVTIDGGKAWFRWSHGYPNASTMDLVIHPRDHDLVVGTHGRAVFVLDDIRPLRTLAEARSKRLHLFDVPPAWQHRIKQTGPPRFAGATEYRGENKRFGAMLTFWASGEDLTHPDAKVQRDRTEKVAHKKAVVRIRDAKGDAVRAFETDITQGLNRFWWNLRRDGTDRPSRGVRAKPPEFKGSGRPVLPGTYQVTIELGDEKVTGKLVVRADPRVAIDRADREAKDAAVAEAEALMNRMAKAMDRIARARRSIGDVKTHLGRIDEKSDEQEALSKAAKKADDALKSLEDQVWGNDDRQGITRSETIMRVIGQPGGSMGSSWDAPTEGQKTLLRRARQRLDDFVVEVDAAWAGPVRAFNDALKAAPLDHSVDPEPVGGKK